MTEKRLPSARSYCSPTLPISALAFTMFSWALLCAIPKINTAAKNILLSTILCLKVYHPQDILTLNDNPKILTILFFSLPRHDTAKAVGEP